MKKKLDDEVILLEKQERGKNWKIFVIKQFEII